jgi:hypothetical protein
MLVYKKRMITSSFDKESIKQQKMNTLDNCSAGAHISELVNSYFSYVAVLQMTVKVFILTASTEIQQDSVNQPLSHLIDLPYILQ